MSAAQSGRSQAPKAERIVWFPQWAGELERAGLPPLERERHRAAIAGFLGFCKRSRPWATVDSARRFTRERRQGGRLEPGQAPEWEAALNRFSGPPGRRPRPAHRPRPRDPAARSRRRS